MKNHLKRIATPRTWVINRKSNKFIVRPNAGGHAFSEGTALGVILRDMLHVAETMAEVKKLLHSQEVLVDGKRRKEHRFIVGLFDVIAVPALKKQWRVVLDRKARLAVVEIPAAEAAMKVCKVVGKTMLPGGKLQFNLHDGKNLIGEHKANVGDSVVLSLPDLAVKEVLPLKEGVSVFLTRGKHGGDTGLLKEFKGSDAVYTSASSKSDVETAKGYLFVVGAKKPAMGISVE